LESVKQHQTAATPKRDWRLSTVKPPDRRGRQRDVRINRKVAHAEPKATPAETAAPFLRPKLPHPQTRDEHLITKTRP